ncbi:MAG: lipoprotein-releasing ABC transporter ATP-binding protein LolD [Gammaproteobacteria bacterium]|nr:lipoprotein-releasing ABC transporter ATP-binding protein LolD [Gammaproteobacteria bacterium]
MNKDIIIECQQIEKIYDDGASQVQVLKSLDLTVYKGERLAIIGQSGSGKSTLLHLLGGLDQPSNGKVIVHGTDIHQLNVKKQGEFRNQYLGFVYQFHHLLAEFTALENVAMPLLIRGNKPALATKKALELIDRVGLVDRQSHKPGELSGGERQRISLARALVTNPTCVLADEPTGNLDQQTADETYGLILELNKSLDTSFVIVTHDRKLAARMDRTLKLMNGHLETVSD